MKKQTIYSYLQRSLVKVLTKSSYSNRYKPLLAKQSNRKKSDRDVAFRTTKGYYVNLSNPIPKLSKKKQTKIKANFLKNNFLLTFPKKTFNFFKTVNVKEKLNFTCQFYLINFTRFIHGPLNFMDVISINPFSFSKANGYDQLKGQKLRSPTHERFSLVLVGSLDHAQPYIYIPYTQKPLFFSFKSNQKFVKFHPEKELSFHQSFYIRKQNSLKTFHNLYHFFSFYSYWRAKKSNFFYNERTTLNVKIAKNSSWEIKNAWEPTLSLQDLQGMIALLKPNMIEKQYSARHNQTKQTQELVNVNRIYFNICSCLFLHYPTTLFIGTLCYLKDKKITTEKLNRNSSINGICSSAFQLLFFLTIICYIGLKYINLKKVNIDKHLTHLMFIYQFNYIINNNFISFQPFYCKKIVIGVRKITTILGPLDNGLGSGKHSMASWSEGPSHTTKFLYPEPFKSHYFFLMRPLFSITRLDTFFICESLKLPTYPDKSNLRVDFLRNRVRKQILPAIRILLNPQFDTILCKFNESDI